MYGAERWILALARNLDRNIVIPYIGALQDEDQMPPICKQAALEGFQNHAITCKRKSGFCSLIELKKFIGRHKIDILHTHGYKTDAFGLLAAKMASVKIVSTPHGWSKKADIKLRIYEIMDRTLLGLCDAVVPLSKQLYNELSRMPWIRRKLLYVRNGVDICEVDSIPRPAVEIAQWRRNRSFIIGYIGRLDPGKAIETLLRMLARYGEFHWKVAIVGEGPEKLKLKALAKDLGVGGKVKFFGYRPDRIAILKGFDAFVLPSLSEGIPRCLMEAMAARIPVVASDIPGCRDLVDHNETGLLFEPNNPQALADALNEIESNRNLVRKLVLKAREKIFNEYSARLMARKYEELYLKLTR